MSIRHRKSNPYEILGVQRTASIAEIKTAYRKAAITNHPDRNGGSAESTAQFCVVTEAYQVLVEPARRATLDQTLTNQERRENETRRAANPTKPGATSSPPLDMAALLRKVAEENRTRQAERRKREKERLAHVIDVLRQNRKPAPTKPSSNIGQSSKRTQSSCFELAKELSKSRPAGEQFVWCMVGSLIDAAVASK